LLLLYVYIIETYRIVVGDLLDPSSITLALKSVGFDFKFILLLCDFMSSFSLPTYYLLECVTAYLPPQNVTSLLSAASANFWIVESSNITTGSASSETSTPADTSSSSSSSSRPPVPLMIVGYDPSSKQSDNFGRVMIHNLKVLFVYIDV
jgi:hypothetical protein